MRDPPLDARVDRSPACRTASSTAGPPQPAPRLGRRAFLGALGGGALAARCPAAGRGRGLRLRRRRGRHAARRRRGPVPRAAADPAGAGRARIEIPIREAEVADPARPAGRGCGPTAGTFPGPTIRRPAGQPHQVTFDHELPAEVGELTVHLHGGHNRTQFDGQPGGLTKAQPMLLLLPDPAAASRRASRATTCCSSPAAPENLRLRPDRGRPARTGRLPVVPRPPPRPHRPQRLARPGRDVDRRRRARRARCRCPRGERDIPLMIADRTFDRHNQLTDPFTDLRPPADGITGAHASSSTAPTCPTTGSRRAATGCGSSTSPASAPTTSTSPTGRR